MARCGGLGFRCRFIARSTKFLVCLVTVWSWAALTAQGVRASQDEPVPTLHVYTNSIQIPTLVLGRDRERIASPIAGERFSVSIDSGPWFRATHVRREGDDPISLAILLDMRRGTGGFMPEIGDVIADLVPSTLHAKDHVSIYALGCDLMRSLNDVPADAAQLKLGVKRALEFWTTQKNVTCLQEDHLWDALAYIAGQLYQLPGRRVILAVSDGRDHGSSHTWDEARSYLQDTGVAVFGISHDSPFLVNRPLQGTVEYKEDLFNLVCESSGGLVLRTTVPSFADTMKTFVTTVRERYIVEFPRPSNTTPGPHGMRVRVAQGDLDFIRAAGITVPPLDPAVLTDPTTVSAGPKDAPVIGDRHITKPQ